MKKSLETLIAAALVAGFGFFAASHVQPSYAYKKKHPKVHCTQTTVTKTFRGDGKVWIMTSSTVCSNGKFKWEGKVR